MKITAFWMAENFDKFNKEYFKGELPTPHFMVSNSRKQLGVCQAKGYKGRTPKFTIKESNFYERNEKDFETTLIHEMIHLYFFAIEKRNENHGKEWQKMARTFDKYGYNIHTTSNLKIIKDNNTTRRTILTFTENKNGMTWVCWLNADTNPNKFIKMLNPLSYTNPKLWTTTSDKASTLKQCYKVLGGKRVTKSVFDKEWAKILIPC